ncbi:MAG TPA: urea amidolyase associated protein UAAP1 [Conexibacter sp.]|nr:urea amidolyase associated protein UAAP1 [Conexibacter sp.]
MNSTTTTTATTHGARDHARAQAGATAEAMPVLPARAASGLPDGVPQERLTWVETVAGGGYASRVLARGTTLRLTDLHGDACAHVLLYNADQPWERLNVADTVKVPWQAYLGAGHPLLSDQGRVLASVVTDTSGHHDALCGTSSRDANARRYGADGGLAHGPAPAGRELFVLAAAKHGLAPRDIPPSLSFFQGVKVEPDGALRFDGSAGAGAHVELRAELPLVVLIANVPHPLDGREDYTCSTLALHAWSGRPTQADDPLWSATPESERAFLNTADYADARGLA